MDEQMKANKSFGILERTKQLGNGNEAGDGAPARSAGRCDTSTLAAGDVRYSGMRAKPHAPCRAFVAEMRPRDLTHDPSRH